MKMKRAVIVVPAHLVLQSIILKALHSLICSELKRTYETRRTQILNKFILFQSHRDCHTFTDFDSIADYVSRTHNNRQMCSVLKIYYILVLSILNTNFKLHIS